MHLRINNPNTPYRKTPGSEVNMAWHSGVKTIKFNSITDKQFCENGSLMPSSSQKCRSDIKCDHERMKELNREHYYATT